MYDRRTMRAFLLCTLLATPAACSDTPFEPQDRPRVEEPSSGEPSPDPPPGAWASLSPMPQARIHVGAAALEDVVYVVGGIAGPRARTLPLSLDRPPPSEVFAYDPSLDTWRSAGRILEGVASPGVAAADGRVYVVGGFRLGSFEPSDRVQVLDVGAGTTVAGPPMPTARGGLAVVFLHGRVHAIGGLIDDLALGYPTGAHEVFDPATGAWTSRAALRTPRSGHGAAALDGRIYVAGGSGGPGSSFLEVYDPATDSWSMPSTRALHASNGAVAALGGSVYLFGGSEPPPECCGGWVPRADVDRFDPERASWHRDAPMSVPRWGHAAAVVGESVYVIGGGSSGPFLDFTQRNERFTPARAAPPGAPAPEKEDSR